LIRKGIPPVHGKEILEEDNIKPLLKLTSDLEFEASEDKFEKKPIKTSIDVAMKEHV
ncbi:MAG: hypothetical protein HYS39_00305, partial [Proteobacteria bacterium]|nr:hypothetical protein [Pseudomonadota bacterium]